MRIATVFLFVMMIPTAAYSQASPGNPSASPNQGSPSPSTVPQPSVGTQTYSVEGNLLSYKALQSDAEAIACDVVDELPGSSPVIANVVANGTGVSTNPCSVAKNVTGARVLVLTSADQSLANYQLWRLALITIDTLQSQADRVTPPVTAANTAADITGVGTAAATALGFIQTIMAFFVSNESVAGLQGTLQDQALADAVARHLRAMGAHVFVPSIYSPFALSGLDDSKSPFLAKLKMLQKSRSLLALSLADKTSYDKNIQQISDDTAQIAKLKAEDEENQKKGKPANNATEIDRLNKEITSLTNASRALSAKYQSITTISNTQLSAVVQNIDNFVTSLIASNVSTPSGPTTPSTTPTPSSNPNPATSPSAPTGSPSTPSSPAGVNPSPSPATPAAPTVPPVVPILYADGLARMLGANPANTNPDTSAWRVLSLKVLDSGATVISKANIFGVKVSYGGGATATYALFDLSGNLYCSANVFDYGGRLKGKEFDDKFRSPDINPAAQLLFSRGRCARTVDDSTSDQSKFNPASQLPQPTQLYTMVQRENFDETPAQARRIAQLKALPTTRSVQIVQVNANALADARIGVTLSNQRVLDLFRTEGETNDLRNLSWTGASKGEEPGGSTMVVRNGQITGSITTPNGLYRITPLGGGAHALVEVDSAKFPKDEPESFSAPQPERKSPVVPHTSDIRNSSASSPTQIDVLVAYTPGAEAGVIDMGATIALAVAEANQSYLNSGIAIHLNLVDSFGVDYKEDGKSFESILADFEHMSVVNQRRDKSGADLATLIINKSDYCGLAHQIMADASTAFSIVYYDCATGYYSFAHELGHLMGARHNEHIDPNAPFTYGHGYCHNGPLPAWRTIMSYNCPVEGVRIQYWSNPRLVYAGVPLGTIATNDNARVLNETAATVAAFRNRP